MSTIPPPPPPPSVPPPPPGGAPPPPGGPPPPPGGYPPGGYVPGTPGPGWQSLGPKPPSYLVWAILTTLFCCLPFGIVSIVFAARVDSKYNAGDVAGSREASEQAKKWAIVSAVTSLVLVAIWFGIVLLAAAGSS